MEAAANVISVTFLVGLIVPMLMYVTSQDIYYLVILGGIVGANAIVMGVKPLAVAVFGEADALLRPDGARDCGALCNGGPSGGRPGFPSGHMTTVTTCVAGLWLHGRDPFALWLGVPWIAAMAWARWAKKCHNWAQIMGGIALGVAIAAGIARFF
jgi:membrane-associated phospholipid phosphatase